MSQVSSAEIIHNAARLHAIITWMDLTRAHRSLWGVNTITLPPRQCVDEAHRIADTRVWFSQAFNGNGQHNNNKKRTRSSAPANGKTNNVRSHVTLHILALDVLLRQKSNTWHFWRTTEDDLRAHSPSSHPAFEITIEQNKDVAAQIFSSNHDSEDEPDSEIYPAEEATDPYLSELLPGHWCLSLKPFIC